MDGLSAFNEARFAENAFFFHKRIFIKASGKDASAEINYILWTYNNKETHFSLSTAENMSLFACFSFYDVAKVGVFSE